MLSRIKGLDDEPKSEAYWAGVALILRIALDVTSANANGRAPLTGQSCRSISQREKRRNQK